MCTESMGFLWGGQREGQDGVLSQGANEDNSAFTYFIYWVCVEDFVWIKCSMACKSLKT